MHSRRILFLSGGLYVWLAITSTQAADSGNPSWIDHPKSDDSVFLYRVGHSEGQNNKAGAQQEAYRNALSVIAEEMMARAGVNESLRPELAANLPIQNAEIVPGAVYMETNQAGYVCWVQVSYPLAEKAKLLERIEPEKKKALDRIEFEKHITSQLTEARTAFARGEIESAQTHLLAVIQNYPNLHAPPFTLQEAQILLGDTYGVRKDFLEARHCYEGVIQTSASTKWKNEASEKLKALPKAPRAWPLNDRWKGKKIALVCAIHNVGQTPRPFAPLNGILNRDCQASRLESVDVTEEIKSDEITALFSQQSLSTALATAKRRGAGVILALLLTTDPVKRGQTKEMMGIALPVPDSEANLMVVDVENAKIVFSDHFNEISGNRSESQFAERVASILVEKYLVPKCPTLGGK